MIEVEIIEFEFFGFVFKENGAYHGGVASRRGLCASTFAHRTMADAKRILKATIKGRAGKFKWVSELKDIEIEDARYILDRFQKELNLYFNGRLKRFTLPIEIGCGSEFDRKVWSRLEQIPYGETVSYGFIAEKIGDPKAARAVGNSCGNNPLPIIIPCHRVFESKGKLGGFTGGVAKKKMLLRLEGSLKQPSR
jgi:O-6-methylguanine DNA methyltransferase